MSEVVHSSPNWPTAREVIEAIRSGSYLWGYGTLSQRRWDGNRCYCIAGIAADLASDRGLGHWKEAGAGEYMWIDTTEGPFKELEWFSSLPEDFTEYTFHGENNLAQLIRKWDAFATWLPENLTPDFMADHFEDVLESFGIVL